MYFDGSYQEVVVVSLFDMVNCHCIDRYVLFFLLDDSHIFSFTLKTLRQFSGLLHGYYIQHYQYLPRPIINVDLKTLILQIGEHKRAGVKDPNLYSTIKVFKYPVVKLLFAEV